MAYAIGQRWISHADTALGLGVVVEEDARRVTLHFPAVEEERTYAIDSAPLTRLKLRVGDTLRTRDGRESAIVAVHEEQALLFYAVAEEGERIAELDLDDRIDLSTPRQRLFAGQVDAQAAFSVRLATCRQIDRLQRSGLRGLLGMRTALLPHQLYVAREVSQRHAPRVLLADEVGLGKTIEAGMILHRQLLTGDSRRALVLVPASLQFQWLVEMRRRFNLAFALLDRERLDAQPRGVNPFASEQLALCPVDLFADKTLQLLALAASWDLVIVDEAHRLSPAVNPGLYAFVEALAAHSPGLLLLTATPEQVGQEAHFQRLTLLDPARFYDFEAFAAQEREYKRWSDLLDALDRGERPEGLPADIPRHLPAAEIAAALIDRYGTGRVLFRNSRAAVGRFPRRRLHTYPLPQPDTQGTVWAGPYPDRVLEREIWLREDPRVAWLVAQLRTLRPEKVLVICVSAATALALEAHLQRRAGIRSAAFHERLSLIERDRAAAYFAEPEQGAQALICSEIGGEGRNFQFARHLVLFDLPPHPDQLEQRIGRLDRIGQRREIHIHAPYLQRSAQEVLLRWYDEGIDLFKASCSAGDMIMARFAERLDAQLAARDAHFETLLEDTRAFTRQTRRELRDGRDRLLERSSCNPEIGQALAEAIAEAEDPEALADYLKSLCAVAGVDCDEHSAHAFVLRPGEQDMAVFPELPEEGCTVTVSRELALQREDWIFLGWEHPWLEGAMESLLASPSGQACVGAMTLRGVPAGSRLYELIFSVSLSAPAYLGVHRYLPLSPERLLLDARGRDLSKLLSHESLNERFEKLPRAAAVQIVRRLRDEIETRLDEAQTRADTLVAAQRDAATANYRAYLGAEIERLVALKALNPALREEEIAGLKTRLDRGVDALAQARATLQGVRLVLTR